MQTKARSFIEDPKPKNIRHDIESDPKKFLEEKLCSCFNFGAVEIMQHGVYKEMGYAYDMRPYLKHYVYKQYGSWHESYALSRANLRTLIHGRIVKILEA